MDQSVSQSVSTDWSGNRLHFHLDLSFSFVPRTCYSHHFYYHNYTRSNLNFGKDAFFLSLFSKVVQNLLKKTEMTEEEQKQIVAKYLEEAEEMKERYNDMQKHSRAVLAAKLAARRRLKEEMRKEQAMKKELKEMAKKQVDYQRNNTKFGYFF